ncbi:hypothetical protein PInf_017337 [Phytophthora infestans]|nr:hypothetical protein PInf_017337 [Phytophthora infestans]
MGHADGLSRLYHRPDASVVSVIRMTDLLNDGDDAPPAQDGTVTPLGTLETNTGDGLAQVGEQTGTAAPGDDSVTEPAVVTEPLTQVEQEEDLQEGAPLTNLSPIDVFGLDYDKFVEEQERVPWMRALRAFLKDGAENVPVSCDYGECVTAE